MIKLLTAPKEAIKEAKKKRNFKKTIAYLLLASLLITGAVAIFLASGGGTAAQFLSLRTSVSWGDIWQAATLVFAVVFLGALFTGFLVKLAMSALGEKSKGYYEGLTSIVYALVAPSICAIIASLVMAVAFVLNSILITWFVAVPILIAGAVLGLATGVRAWKELFEAEWIVAFLGYTVLSGGAAIVSYILMQYLTWLMVSRFL